MFLRLLLHCTTAGFEAHCLVMILSPAANYPRPLAMRGKLLAQGQKGGRGGVTCIGCLARHEPAELAEGGFAFLGEEAQGEDAKFETPRCLEEP